MFLRRIKRSQRNDDLQQGQMRREKIQQQLALLDQARGLRERMAATGQITDSAHVLNEIREERLDDLMGLC